MYTATILFSLLLISCGSDDKQDDSVVNELQGDSVVNELLGTWKTGCLDDSDEYTITTLEVKEKTINSQFTSYSTSSCENVLTSTPLESTYTLGEEATTILGNEIRNIDIMLQNGDVVIDIFKIEQGYLYFGEARDDTLRADTIDFTSWFEKQY